MYTLENLCRDIMLPEVVTQQVLELGKTLDVPQRSLLCSKPTWDEGLKQVELALGEDPKGFKMLTLMLHTAVESKSAYEEKGIPEEKEYFTYGMAAQEGMYSIELRYPSLEKTYGVPRRASKINANEAKSYHIVEIDRNMIDTSKHVGYRELIYDRNRLYRRYFIRILIALVACISILVALSL